jgi:choice-of-anchor A domain-containing protein
MKKPRYLFEGSLRSPAKTGLAWSFIFAIILFSATMAGASGLGTAGDFNTFIFGDYACTSDAEGKVAVGGNMNVDSYSVAYELPDRAGEDMLIVGGNLSFGNGEVYYGNIVVGGSATYAHANTADGTATDGVDPLPIDFEAEEAYLKALSQELAALTPTGTAKGKWSGLRIVGDGSSTLQVFDVNGSKLSSLTWLHALEGIPEDATLLFNISGTSSGMTGGWQPLTPYHNKVLFNFYEATSLSFNNIAVEGSVLAPYAQIENPTGVIWGTVVAASWDGHMQQNHVPFEGELPEEESCESELGTVTCGTATVDGSYDEWDLSEDFYAEMHEAGNPCKDHLSNLYLRYDVLAKTMYALVLREGGNSVDASADDAWIKIYDLGKFPQVDGNSASFEWVYDNGTLLGYEASFSLENKDYIAFEAHLSVNGGDTSSSGKKKQGYIPLTIDCQEPPTEPASLGDFVWEDSNGNGEQDLGEAGVEGVVVKLYTCDDSFVAETATDAAGKYLFEKLEPGDYYVSFSNLPDGYVLTEQGLTGTSDATDSDAYQASGKTECTTLESGENDMTWDAGIVKGAGITKYQRLDDDDEWTIDPLFGLQAGETISYQISVDNFYYADDMGFTIMDSLSDLVEFDSLTGVEKVNADGTTELLTADIDYLFNYDADLHAVSLDYLSTLQSGESLNFLFDVTAVDGFGGDMMIENQASVEFGDDGPIDSNIVTVYAVPEPGTVFLLGLGLFGVLSLKRKFKK